MHSSGGICSVFAKNWASAAGTLHGWDADFYVLSYLQFLSSMKAPKGEKNSWKPFTWNFLIPQSLDEHALKNSVILELYDF